MITLLGNYVELLAKLDKDEQIKYISQAMPLIKKESIMYEDKHITTVTSLSKLRKIKSEILGGKTDISYIYPILEADSEYEDDDEDIDTTNEQK